MLHAALGRAGPAPTEARASALIGAGLLAAENGDHRESIDLCDEGLACARTAGSTRIEINALSLLAVFGERCPEEQIRLGEEAIAGARAYGDSWLLGLVTGNHGVVLSQLGETEKATESDGGGIPPLPSGGRRLPDGDLDQQSRRGRPAGREHQRSPSKAGRVARTRPAHRRHARDRHCHAEPRLGRAPRRRLRPRPRLLRGGGGDRAAAREAGLWRRGDLWLLSFGGSRWRCRPCRAPRGRRVRARRRCRIQPELLGHARSARKGCPRGPGRARLAEGLGRRCGARLRLRVQPGARLVALADPYRQNLRELPLLAVRRE